MSITEAFQIVLDLAKGNVLSDDQAKGGMEDEQFRQNEAIEKVEEYIALRPV